MSGNEKKAAEVFKYLNDGLLYNWTHRSAEPETLMWRKNTSCGGTRLPEEGRGPHCFLDAEWPPHHTTRAEVMGNQSQEAGHVLGASRVQGENRESLQHDGSNVSGVLGPQWGWTRVYAQLHTPIPSICVDITHKVFSKQSAIPVHDYVHKGYPQTCGG